MIETRILPVTWALMALLALIWGGSFLAIRTALDEVPPFTTVTHRVFWACLLLWAVLLARRTPLPRSPAVWGAFLVMGLLNNVVPFTLMAWGQLHIESGLTAILNAATAIWGVLVAALIFPDERLTRRRVAGVAIGFAGVAIAIGLHEFQSLNLRSLAQLAVIGGTVSYALAGSWARAHLKAQTPLVAATGMLTGSTLVMLPVSGVVEGAPSLDLSWPVLSAIGYYSIIATAGAYMLYYAILSRAGVGMLLVVTLMIPPVAILLGAWGRDEALSGRAYAGFAVLALGLILLGLPRRHGSAKPVRP